MSLSKLDLILLVKSALAEDIGRQDITTRLTIPRNRKVKASIVAKQNGIICGINIAGLVFMTLDKNIRFTPLVCDGDRVRKGNILARVYGSASKILTAERVALNFLSMLSGIATKTRKYVEAVKPYKIKPIRKKGKKRAPLSNGVKIYDTRKTLPGLRSLEKYAVRMGGGYNHRSKLDEMVLIKDNHLKVMVDRLWVMGLKEKIKKIRKEVPKKVKIEVEVKNLKEFKEALEAKPDIIMLDNMKISDIKKAVTIKRHMPYAIRHTLIEVSGNITLDNIKNYARCKVDFISVGSLTKDIDSLDISLDIV